MASTLRTSATPNQIWNVLSDAWLYAGWVVGSSRIRDVDPQWPRPGTRFHHSVGAWPLLSNDFTEVISQEPHSHRGPVPGQRLSASGRGSAWDVRLERGPRRARRALAPPAHSCRDQSKAHELKEHA